MSSPPSAPPQRTQCARCGRYYPAGSEHVCDITERDPAPTAVTPPLSGVPTETVNLGLAPTLSSPPGGETPPGADLERAPTLATSPAAASSAELSNSGLNPVFNPQDALIGTVINERFKVLRRIGKGGMGAVYKARHLGLDTNVAIKVLLHQRSHDDQERFIQEAKLASKVRHPNTVYISDFGFLPDGRLYLVMELLAGRILSSEISKGPLELTRALNISIQIARGLQAVHDKGIVHRDMKPENVFLLTQDGTQDFVKIVDFGIAKATTAASLTEDASSPLNLSELEKALLAEETAKSGTWAKTETRAGQTIGTPPYMSPEQVQSLPVDFRTDQYALGCMLYEMISGELPFIAKSSVALMMKHLTVPPPKLRDRFPKLQVSESLDALVQRLLSKEQRDRFPTMRDVETALHQELDRLLVQRGEKVMLTSEVARRLTVEVQRSRLVIAGRRVPLWAMVPLLSLLVLGGVLAGVRLLRPRPPAPRERLAPAELLALRGQALEVLRESLRGTDAELKLDALEALGQTRDLGLRGQLEAALAEPTPVLQAQAAEALGQLGDRAATASLSALLDKSKDAMVLVAAAAALQILGDERGLGALGQLLREPDPDGQFRAALALAEAGNQEAQAKLLAYLGRGGVTEPRRLRVLATLARGGEPTALPTLQRLMTTPGPLELRLGAASKLAQLGEDSGRLFLREQSHKPGPSQLLAARLLAAPEETEAVELLRRVFADPRSVPTTRLLATEGLGSGGDSLDARGLAGQLRKDQLPVLRQAAAIAVLQIAGRDPNTLSAQNLAWARGALSDRDWMVREAAAAALGSNDAPAAVELLTGAMRDLSSRVRQAAAHSLGQQKTRAARDLLLAALGDSDSAVRVEALRSLGRVAAALAQRGDSSLAALQGTLGSVLASRPPLEQALAVGILLRLGDREQLGRLRTLLKDPDPAVRRAAIEQLAAQVPEQAELLVQLLTDSDHAVRFAAARKLAVRGDKRAIPALTEALTRGGVDGLVAYVLLNKLGEKVVPPADFDTSFAAATLPARLEVVDTLGELPADLVLPLLRRASRDSEAAVRRKVAELAAALRGPDGAPVGLPLLRLLLSDRDLGVRARVEALLSRLLSAPPEKEKTPEAPPPPAASSPPAPSPADGGSESPPPPADAAASASSEGEPAAGRGHLIVETPPGVHFQIDKGPYQTATKAALPLAAGRHLITAISGVQEVQIKPGATVTIRLEASQAEQLFRDGRDNFNKPDYAKAKRQLEKASALCARDHKHGQACAGLTLEASFLLGKIYEDQNDLPQAMSAFQRVTDREANVRGMNEQKAYAQAAIARLRPKLGQVVVTQKGKRGCQEEVNWVHPGTTFVRLNGSLQSVTVKAGSVVNVGSCN